MQKPTYHFFVCNSFRMKGEPQGVCNKNGAPSLMETLSTEIADRGLDAQISSCGCLQVCDRGPAMIVYPQGWWYGEIDEGKLDEILDALEDGETVEGYLIA